MDSSPQVKTPAPGSLSGRTPAIRTSPGRKRVEDEPEAEEVDEVGDDDEVEEGSIQVSHLGHHPVHSLESGSLTLPSRIRCTFPLLSRSPTCR